MKRKIKVIYVKPDEKATVIEIEDTLEVLQEKVKGDIEAFYAFEDPVAIICNESGKISGLTPNRAIRHNGEILDIIVGNFLIAYVPQDSSNFESLPDTLLYKYLKMFELPEMFLKDDAGKVIAIKYEP